MHSITYAQLIKSAKLLPQLAEKETNYLLRWILRFKRICCV